MKAKEKTVSRREKQLEKKLAEATSARETLIAERNFALDEALRMGKQAGELSNLSDHLHSKVHFVERENAQLSQANSVAAQGMMIERDELLARANRLEMRIKGLGC